MDNLRRGYWVRFREDGVPSAFSGAWFDGAEFVEGIPEDTLITCRRVDGVWLDREPEAEGVPSPEGTAAEREAEHQAAVDARDAALKTALLESDAFAQYLLGKITRTTYVARVAEIEVRFPMPSPAAPGA